LFFLLDQLPHFLGSAATSFSLIALERFQFGAQANLLFRELTRVCLGLAKFSLGLRDALALFDLQLAQCLNVAVELLLSLLADARFLLSGGSNLFELREALLLFVGTLLGFRLQLHASLFRGLLTLFVLR